MNINGLRDYAIDEVLTHDDVNTITKKTSARLLLHQLLPDIEDALSQIQQMRYFGGGGMATV